MLHHQQAQPVPGQPRPVGQQMPQQPLQQIPPTPIQRVSTPVDRAGSPPNVNSHVNMANQQRQQVPQAMSPNQPSMQLPPQQQMQVPQGVPQGMQQQQVPQGMQTQQQQVQQQQAAMGRSPAPGTPMTAGPNSPAPPRPGSAAPQQQQQPQRPQSAAGTPIQQQPQQQIPGQPGQQQQIPRPQSAIPQQVPQNQQQAQQQQQRMPIPSTLSVPQPVPVAIPAPRPSLSGGANNAGNTIMGTPAMIKQPAFEFDGEGMSLLSKRKLEELVKQIDPDERLDPDVEECILELVDEFIDTITSTACKMAKLRGSDTLDIKDIQIILERNWNIRIPGYSADEIRTVRKFNPAPGYHHKMNALIAHKQMAQSNGKGDV
ncbi:transcription initiation factor TFIID subunit A-domain-containing protein [Pyronema omphalodes]|nr:transcription initiation factor TFIID subunit A-domain-containing protein [Pyronema omphalodes]